MVVLLRALEGLEAQVVVELGHKEPQHQVHQILVEAAVVVGFILAVLAVAEVLVL